MYDGARVMLSSDLETSLNVAIQTAREAVHEFITVEHLLLALLDNPSASRAIHACGGDLDRLQKELNKFLDQHVPLIPENSDVDPQPGVAFQRVIQRAILHVQSSGKKEVNGTNVLIAMFAEQDSHAVYFLHQQDQFLLFQIYHPHQDNVCSKQIVELQLLLQFHF